MSVMAERVLYRGKLEPVGLDTDRLIDMTGWAGETPEGRFPLRCCTHLPSSTLTHPIWEISPLDQVHTVQRPPTRSATAPESTLFDITASVGALSPLRDKADLPGQPVEKDVLHRNPLSKSVQVRRGHPAFPKFG